MYRGIEKKSCFPLSLSLSHSHHSLCVSSFQPDFCCGLSFRVPCGSGFPSPSWTSPRDITRRLPCGWPCPGVWPTSSPQFCSTLEAYASNRTGKHTHRNTHHHNELKWCRPYAFHNSGDAILLIFCWYPNSSSVYHRSHHLCKSRATKMAGSKVWLPTFSKLSSTIAVKMIRRDSRHL